MYGLLVACFATSAYAADASKVVDAVAAPVEGTTPVGVTTPKAVTKPKLTQEQADALIKSFSSRFATPKTEKRFVIWYNSMKAFFKTHPWISGTAALAFIAASVNHFYQAPIIGGAVKTYVSDKTVAGVDWIYGWSKPYGTTGSTATTTAIFTAEVLTAVGLIYALAQDVEVEGEFEAEDEGVAAPEAPAVVPAVPVITEAAVAPAA